MFKIPKVILDVDISIAFGRGVFRGVVKYVRLHGPWNLISKPPFYRQLKRTPIEKSNADGIIMHTDDIRKIQRVSMSGIPAIVSYMKKPAKNLPILICDDDEIGKMAAEHLLSCYLKSFAFCGYNDFHWSRDRQDSFSKKIAKAGFKTYTYKQPASRIKQLWENEKIIIADWLKSLPKPVGLMACNDYRGQQVIEACKSVDIHIPDGVAIIGVDNDEQICELTDPPLSSVILNAENAGYEAAKLLDKFMAGKKMTNQKILVRPGGVYVRQSTNILAIEDKHIAKAVNFIRQHAKHPIQVNDVARAVGLSRRILEIRFRKILGRSVHDEIQYIRIEQIARMLIETNLSVSYISTTLGYPSLGHIARYFKKIKGLNPTDYRKKYGPSFSVFR